MGRNSVQTLLATLVIVFACDEVQTKVSEYVKIWLVIILSSDLYANIIRLCLRLYLDFVSSPLLICTRQGRLLVNQSKTLNVPTASLTGLKQFCYTKFIEPKI